MKFSVIIPVFNEAEFIAQTIRAVQKQNQKRKDFEILIVDNNSTDDTVKIAQQSGADRVVVESRQGTNFARQRGFKEALGEIVVFLDGDSIPPVDWLNRIERNLSQEGVKAVSGPFNYGFSGWKKKFDYLYENKFLPNVPRWLEFLFRKKAGVIIGGNFATRRQYIDVIGGLPLLSFWGDDAAIAMLISRRVGRVLFDPKLAIKSSPRRFKNQGFLRLVLRYILAYLKIYFSKKKF